jgi:hypothetical protein
MTLFGEPRPRDGVGRQRQDRNRLASRRNRRCGLGCPGTDAREVMDKLIVFGAMVERLSSRPDAVTMVGVSLIALAALSLISHVLGITDALVAANCGAAPSRNYAVIDTYIAFLHCQRTVEQSYWNVISVLAGCIVGYGARAWLRREAKQDAQRDKQLNDEMARIRADAERRRTLEL